MQKSPKNTSVLRYTCVPPPLRGIPWVQKWCFCPSILPKKFFGHTSHVRNVSPPNRSMSPYWLWYCWRCCWDGLINKRAQCFDTHNLCDWRTSRNHQSRSTSCRSTITPRQKRWASITTKLIKKQTSSPVFLNTTSNIEFVIITWCLTLTLDTLLLTWIVVVLVPCQYMLVCRSTVRAII